MTLSIPVWSLLAFAAWTLIVLMIGVGIQRWAQILTGRAAINDFPADRTLGSDAYRRAMRAHANCIENLPVFGAIVLCIAILNIASPLLDVLSVATVAARVAQSTLHLSLRESRWMVSTRFSFFSVQLIAMLVMIAVILQTAAA
ncbi:MAG: MAPEG family protein [Ferrovibrio sp.]